MGRDITNFYHKDMPFILIHRIYADSIYGDTTEKILTFFSDGLITDVNWYRDDPQEDTLVESQHAIFQYKNQQISKTYVLARADDKLVPNEKINYSNTDSTTTSVFSYVICVGSSNFITSFKDVYSVPASDMTLSHHHSTWLDLGTGQASWYENYFTNTYYNTILGMYDRDITVYQTQKDTLFTDISYSTQKDTIFSITTEKKNRSN